VKLRTRFTLAVAAAVAVATMTIAAVAYLVIRADLRDQVQRQLTARAASVLHDEARLRHGIPYGWIPPHSDRFGESTPYTQIITSAGGLWAPAGYRGALSGTRSAEEVAAGTRGTYSFDTTINGVHALVLVSPLGHGLALEAAEPLDTVDGELTSIAAALTVLSGIGIGLAALTGWAVARGGLAPVGRLAAVTEQVAMTGDLHQGVDVRRQDELGRLAASFNTMLAALRRSVAAQRQLVSDASHEFRTPLTSLRVNVDLLASEPDLPARERREILDRVVHQVTELSGLVVSVTELARGETPSDAFEVVDLHEVAAAALESAHRDWPRTRFDVDVRPCLVTGSAERLRVAVRNLVDNAAKFGPREGPVEVRLSGDELTVRDHGPGIAAEDLPRVFDRFYRATADRSVQGSGLGLAIVRQIAHAHGGAVTAENPPGGGTLLRLRLPGVRAG
jgi:two-component system, OmpR family, sensor histidine kinase MprB